MSKVIFVAFSDFQIEDWKKYSTNHSRFFAHTKVLKQVKDLCDKYACPALFAGDLFDNNKHLSNFVLNHVFTWFNELTHIPIYAISGNHDQSEANYWDTQSPSYIQMMSTIYPNFKNLDFRTVYNNKLKISISGLPYISYNYDYPKVLESIRSKLKPGYKNILLVHTDLWGAKDTTGREVNTVQNIDQKLSKFFRGFHLVLGGHIHLNQRLRDNIIILGATHQQRTSDKGVKMKVWLVMDDLSVKAIDTNMPEFTDDPQETNGLVIDKPITKIETSLPSSKAFKSLDPSSLAKNYFKEIKIKNTRKLNLLTNFLKDARDKSI